MKNEYATRLLHAMFLQDDKLDPVFLGFMRAEGQFNEQQQNALLPIVKRRFMESSMLQDFTTALQEQFTPAEIKQLVEMHESPLMRKLCNCGTSVLQPVYAMAIEAVNTVCRASKPE